MEDRIKALHIGADKQDVILKHLKMRTAESEKRYFLFLKVNFVNT